MRDKRTASDWKYMRDLKPQLLNQLCERINQKTIELLADEVQCPHDRYLAVYHHIQESNKIVADCFDDWRRSTLPIKLLFLRKHDLLTDEHLDHLSEQTVQGIR